ncbi:hypothetical protein [Clostridium sporogenes]|uniref:hypothetical protein n=1 Tax=Clostridium sporogenes TaxID=1509 RepID=UPI0013D58B03|nr:hypothetical protein [Clostridium sporogenes]NFH40743.1 hypothetical protein [Clostridium sporogenes]
MYKNEYLEKCLKNEKGSYYLLAGYRYTKDYNFNKLVIDDLGFIYNKPEKLKELKEELVKANIKSFVLTASSSALMNYLHGLDSVNIKLKEVEKVSYIDKWEKEECFKEGLEMIVK